MPYFYNVEKKIGANIVILTLIGIISFSVCIYLFISNYIQKKRLKSIYDYMLVKDYDNASFVFKDMHNKNPLDKNILMTGIDLYYDVIINGINENIIISSCENIIKYARQILITGKFLKNKYNIYQRLAFSYQKLGSSYYDDSYDSYIKALENGDNRVSTVIELSKVCYNIGLYKEAINYLENIIKNQNITNIELYYELANAYEGNKDYTKSIQTLSYITDKFNGNIDIELKTYFKLGNLYFRQGLYKESEFFYKKALEMDDKNPNLYYSIGILYRQDKRRKEAINMFREALKIDNSYKPAIDALRRL